MANEEMKNTWSVQKWGTQTHLSPHCPFSYAFVQICVPTNEASEDSKKEFMNRLKSVKVGNWNYTCTKTRIATWSKEYREWRRNG